MKKAFIFWSCLLLILAVTVGTGGRLDSGDLSRSQAQIIPEEAQGATPSLAQGFGNLPLYFVPNAGQIDDKVSFYIQGANKAIYFTPEGVTFALSYSSEPRDKSEPRKLFQPYLRSNEKQMNRGGMRWAVKLDFVGARKDVRPEGLEETGAIISYFRGKTEEWKAGIPAYSKILYRDLWPGIDLVYQGEVNKLKYEFIVHPAADPGQIRLACRGADRVEVTEEGRLWIATPAGVFEDDSPVAYQEIRGERKRVPLAYALDDPAKGHGPEVVSGNKKALEMAPSKRVYEYGFDVGEYDRNATLVLDPAVLVYCGYIGGSDEDIAFAIALDASKNVYVTGYSFSGKSNFPVVAGPDLTQNGDMDAFVAKVDSSGTALIYCGYIGGSGVDICGGIAVDPMGNAYVAGSTHSSEATFPVKVGPDLTYNGGDAFVAKVNSSGTGLIYCGYIGPTGFDFPTNWHADIAVDSAGYAYVIGSTSYHESAFPVKVGPDLTYNGGAYDAYVAKVSPSGSDLVYCGYIGGSGLDFGGAIAVDDSGNAYIAGQTESTESTFPVKVGPDLTFNGGSSDGFVAKINSSGSGLMT